MADKMQRVKSLLQYAILFLGIITCFGCTYRPKQKRLGESRNSDKLILKTFYKKSNDTIEFRRILASNSEIALQNGQLYLDEYGLTYQRFEAVTTFKNESKTIDSLSMHFEKEGWTAKLGKERDVMFIQIIPDSAMSNLESFGFVDLRQSVEDKIDEALKRGNLGEWFAGDMGAGGNMLFFINDWDSATELVLEVLNEEGLLDHVLVTKRIMTGEEDWNYEIVYPVEFEGVFNSM
ncbi:hypothetical protein SAMN04488109_3365 [Chryseolinea serpens]|uniref:Uncharacterized protein n=1 Tax=Chryseolinea serpens TaxID=947013 RepID=A0A1M5RF83_9BACT|nr:hypothetical protein [Chryseolinea serpens]SHH25017.1 hypothetical protein SAMN04488109_3365 [Chryseolinea serpens]